MLACSSAQRERESGFSFGSGMDRGFRKEGTKAGLEGVEI